MILEDFGIKLVRLTEDKIELVRKWRNSEDIQQYMEYRKEITPEMQQAWFKKINNDNNYFFLIIAKDKEIGLMNLKDIDFVTKTAEKGSLIWEKELRGKGIGIRANCILLDFAFSEINLNYITINILKNNPRSIHLNKQFGFTLVNENSNQHSQEYTLTKEEYTNNRENILSIIKNKHNI